MNDILSNLKEVQDNIAAAAARSGRRAQDVTLVCVTKQVTVPVIKQVVSAGITVIGENRVAEAVSKYEQLALPLSWQMIGHLQTRKVREAVKIFDLIHSVDSVSLAQEIDRRAAAIGKKQDILIEVNLSGEESKYGFPQNDLLPAIKEMALLPQISIIGLMTMAPLVSDPELTRPVFRRLREIKEQIAAENIPQVVMKYLSMGMSQDYEVAVEEGANMVRIGSAIFL